MRVPRQRRLVGRPLAVGLLLLAFAAVSGSTPASAASCWRVHDDSSCLRVSVPLDRSGALPGTIHLRVRVASPRLGVQKGTILALVGGPGQAGAALLDSIDSGFPSSALRFRQLVSFDQRGTGRSGRLRCPELSASLDEGAFDPEGAVQRVVAACAERIGPARAHYTTADTVEDIEAVRVALGEERLVLYGTSYGTKVALDYAAAYPDHVSRLVLDSVVPPEGVDPFERATLAAIPPVMEALCARGGCPFTRDPGGDVATLAQRLGRGPLRGYVVNGHGRRRPASLDRRDLFTLLLTGDLAPSQRVLVPAAVRAAVEGDPALLLRLAAVPGSSFDREGGDSEVLYLATTCADGGVPWASGTPISARGAAVADALAAIPADELAPFGRDGVRELGFADLCRAWPEAPVVQPRLPLPDVPTLILSGDGDLRTPRSDALALAQRMPRARVVTVPNAGHSVLGSDPGDCASTAVAQFLAGRDPRACHAARRSSETTPARLPSRSLRVVQPLPGLPPHVGRTVAAVGETFVLMTQATIVDLAAGLDENAKAIRIGGLRGGNLTFTPKGLAMERYCVVPGVTVSARLFDDGEEKGADGSYARPSPVLVHVGGRAAAHGWLRIGERWTSGRLDGRSLRVLTRRLEGSKRSAATARAPAGQLADVPPSLAIPSVLRRLLRLV